MSKAKPQVKNEEELLTLPEAPMGQEPPKEEKIHPVENLSLKLLIASAEIAEVRLELAKSKIKNGLLQLGMAYKLDTSDEINPDKGGLIVRKQG